MFESITVTARNSFEYSKPLDIGSLVESMLFYGQSTLVANYAMLDQLYQYFGGEYLYRLLSEEFLNIVYLESTVGIRTDKQNETDYHNIIQFDSPQHQFQDKLREICIGASGKKGAARRLAQRLERYISVSRETPKVLEGAKESILNQRYTESSARIILKELVPSLELNEIGSFKTHQEKDGIVLETDINFAKVNEVYHKKVSPSDSTITPAFILAHILKLEEELFFASSHLSELCCSDLSSQLGMNKIDYLIERSAKSSQNLRNFNEFVFNDVKAIREAVNANQVNLEDLFKALEQSRKFKKWLHGLPPDAHLFKSYHEEIMRESFLQKLPGKAIRYSVFASLGLLADACLPKTEAIITALSLGAFETFFLDKIASGWKPNQYVDGNLRKLIRAKENE